MRPTHWVSDDGKFEGSVEADVAAYEERQKNALAWLALPWRPSDIIDQPGFVTLVGMSLINLTPKWLAMFQKSQSLLNDGDISKWKQEMIVEIDTLEQEFMAIVREPVHEIPNPPIHSIYPDPFHEIASDIVERLHRDNELQAREDAER